MIKYRIDFNFGTLPQPPQGDDSVLFHYCSMKSLDAILKSRTMRLYDLYSMNDPSELFVRSVDFSKIIADEYIKKPFNFKYTRNECEGDLFSYLDLLGQGYFLFKGKRNNTISFALCLSQQGDNLSQWRLYGDNGNGVCLGFKRSALEKFMGKNVAALWQEVEYVPDLDELCRNLARDILGNIQKMYASGDNEGLLKYQATMCNQIYEEASRYKTDAYSAEEEFRLVIQKESELFLATAPPTMIVEKKFIDDSMDFDVSEKAIKAFTTIPLDDLGFCSITLGPKNETSPQMMNLLLAKRNMFSPVKIYKSIIPYR